MRSDTGHQAAVLGAGSWGTALAIHLASAGHAVTLWGRDGALVEEMRHRRANPTYLPDITFPPQLKPVSALDEALAGARHVIIAIPSHGLRAAVNAAAPAIPRGAVLVSATKGIEEGTLQRMSEVVRDETGGRHAVVALSGPSFAAEVARHLPTALVAASTDPLAVKAVQDEFRGPAFRLYATDDVVGVEIGAALKNIIAIAAGVTESMNLGHNAMSALITRGLAEISRLACAMGGRRESLSGLSGLGDLVLTCTGALSRNRHVGIELGRGRSLDEILAGMRMVAEGVRTTSAALALGERYGVELPIAAQMAEVLAGRSTPAGAVGNLMLRPQRVEHDAANQ
ncbi:MAG TPA: NAD(P)H-dependent glycerol-3-phosphate dehydrogenase [Vicinamibacterales bacterium]|nr:NAD(P)H-dependent glycerol-3-phosphate dehydrogenase [Vicinamibacterales bacterium]